MGCRRMINACWSRDCGILCNCCFTDKILGALAPQCRVKEHNGGFITCAIERAPHPWLRTPRSQVYTRLTIPNAIRYAIPQDPGPSYLRTMLASAPQPAPPPSPVLSPLLSPSAVPPLSVPQQRQAHSEVPLDT